jgi:hypothetical protein
VTRDHLPRLLGLLDAFALRHQQLPEADWWARYGLAWAAIRQDLLTKFSPAEIDQATACKSTDALSSTLLSPPGNARDLTHADHFSRQRL